MSTELVAKVFDYSLIEDKDDKGKLINLEGSISRRLSKTAKDMLETGQEIKTAHAILAKYKDGTFCQWVEQACDISLRTAQNYMNAFDKFGIDATVAKIEVSAMYALASPSTPNTAFTEAKKLADKGVAITQKVAKAIIKKHKPKAESNGKPDHGKCPNCGGSKWTDDNGLACAKCHHPHGEPVGDVDEDRVSIQRSKTVKTVEALMRAFDDLNFLSSKPRVHGEAIRLCKAALVIAREWNG